MPGPHQGPSGHACPAAEEVANLRCLHPGELEGVFGLTWPEIDAAYYQGDAFLLSLTGVVYYLPAFLICGLRNPDSNVSWTFPLVLNKYVGDIIARKLLTVEQAKACILACRYLRRGQICFSETTYAYKLIIFSVESYCRRESQGD
jgi:hypothetical protein